MNHISKLSYSSISSPNFTYSAIYTGVSLLFLGYIGFLILSHKQEKTGAIKITPDSNPKTQISVENLASQHISIPSELKRSETPELASRQARPESGRTTPEHQNSGSETSSIRSDSPGTKGRNFEITPVKTKELPTFQGSSTTPERKLKAAFKMIFGPDEKVIEMDSELASMLEKHTGIFKSLVAAGMKFKDFQDLSSELRIVLIERKDWVITELKQGEQSLCEIAEKLKSQAEKVMASAGFAK